MIFQRIFRMANTIAIGLTCFASHVVLTQCSDSQKSPRESQDERRSGIRPELNHGLITARSMDPGHVLLEGRSGAAAGRVLFIQYGEKTTLDRTEARMENIDSDGAFCFVVDALANYPLTLWASTVTDDSPMNHDLDERLSVSH